MTLATTVQSLNPGNITSYLEIDFSSILSFKPTGTTLLRISSHRNGTADIVYGGNTYNYVGFTADGFRSELGGQPPKPRLVIDKAGLLANPIYDNLFGQSIDATSEYFFDWRGARVKFFRVLNLAEALEVENYVVNQITREDAGTLEIELAVSLGIDRSGSDSIQSLGFNRCSLRYRKWDSTINDFTYVDEAAGGCPYGNPTTISNWTAVPDFGNKYFNATDVELAPANKNLDACSYTAAGCQKRFDPAEQGLALPFVMLYSPNQVGKNV